MRAQFVHPPFTIHHTHLSWIFRSPHAMAFKIAFFMKCSWCAPCRRVYDGCRYPVGVLSAIDRDWAADVRPELVALNKDVMEDIDSALFCLTLDDEAPEDPASVRLWVS